jgi:hypothetical protein
LEFLKLALDVARDGSWEFHTGPVTSFLPGLLRGQVSSRHLYCLSEAEQHTFTPAPD